MNVVELINLIIDKDDKKAYKQVKKIIEESKISDAYYKYLDDFASLLLDEKSYIRTRAFILCCYQTKWDENRKIETILPEMLKLFHDEKPTVVRQCLKNIKEILRHKPNLSTRIEEELNKIDLTKYSDSMKPLIQKDIDELLELIVHK